MAGPWLREGAKVTGYVIGVSALAFGTTVAMNFLKGNFEGANDRRDALTRYVLAYQKRMEQMLPGSKPPENLPPIPTWTELLGWDPFNIDSSFNGTADDDDDTGLAPEQVPLEARARRIAALVKSEHEHQQAVSVVQEVLGRRGKHAARLDVVPAARAVVERNEQRTGQEGERMRLMEEQKRRQQGREERSRLQAEGEDSALPLPRPEGIAAACDGRGEGSDGEVGGDEHCEVGNGATRVAEGER